MGRLDPRIKFCAQRIIDENLDLKKWEGSSLYRKRERALRQAREKIDSPQPSAKPIPKPLPTQLAGWEFGEIIGVRIPNGKLALLHMIAYRTSSRYGARAPVVSILNWTGSELPSMEELAALTYINWRRIIRGNHLYCLASPKRSPLATARFTHSGLKKPVTRGEGTAAYRSLAHGESLDDLLIDILEPYWDNPELPPHHPGFDKPQAELFKRKPAMPLTP
jgi:hypothetical protein